MPIYQPREDSYLMQETLKKCIKDLDSSIKILDMGTGSGILALTCWNLGFENIIAADIDEDSLTYLKKLNKLLKIKIIKSDLFFNLKNQKFDLIIFNPPYLPEDKREPINSKIHTTAGKKGYEIIVRFLEQAKNYLNKDGKILLLFSSLSKPKIIISKAKLLGYNYKLLNKKKLFFEEIFVYEFSRKS